MYIFICKTFELLLYAFQNGIFLFFMQNKKKRVIALNILNSLDTNK